MRRLFVLVSAIGILVGQVYAQDVALKSQKEKLSYSIGMDIGMTLKNQAIDVDAAILARGIRDSLSGQKPLMTEQEIRDTINTFQKGMMAKQQEMMKQATEKNKKEGEAFLAENKKKEGVKTLPSGLQYKVTKAGTGKKPKAVHPRIIGDPPQTAGPLKGIRADIEAQDYWNLGQLDWDRITTKPSKKKLLELGLNDVAKELWPDMPPGAGPGGPGGPRPQGAPARQS